MGEFNVNKSDGSLEQTAGMPDTYPASQVTYGNGSVEDALDKLTDEGNTTVAATYFKLNLNFSRKGGIGFFYYNSDVINIPAGDLGTIGTIPIGYRPANNIVVMSMSKDMYVQLILTSNGNIIGYNYGSAYSGDKTCRYSIVAYPLA